MSSVSGLNARPRRLTFSPRKVAKLRSSISMTRCGCLRLIWITVSSSGIGWPAASPWATSAFTSFGRQLPPKPQPASRNDVIGAVTRAPSASVVVK